MPLYCKRLSVKFWKKDGTLFHDLMGTFIYKKVSAISATKTKFSCSLASILQTSLSQYLKVIHAAATVLWAFSGRALLCMSMQHASEIPSLHFALWNEAFIFSIKMKTHSFCTWHAVTCWSVSFSIYSEFYMQLFSMSLQDATIVL